MPLPQIDWVVIPVAVADGPRVLAMLKEMIEEEARAAKPIHAPRGEWLAAAAQQIFLTTGPRVAEKKA